MYAEIAAQIDRVFGCFITLDCGMVGVGCGVVLRVLVVGVNLSHIFGETND